MALQTSGPITLTDIANEFGGTVPHSLSEYYAGGANVPAGTSGTNGAVPSSGAISLSDFYGTEAVAPPVIVDRGFQAGTSGSTVARVEYLTNTFGSDNYAFSGYALTGYLTGSSTTQFPSGTCIGQLRRTAPSIDGTLDKLAIGPFSTTTAANTAVSHLNAIAVQSIVTGGTEVKSYKTSVWLASAATERVWVICNAPGVWAAVGASDITNPGWGRVWHRGEV